MRIPHLRAGGQIHPLGGRRQQGSVEVHREPPCEPWERDSQRVGIVVDSIYD